ncbi:phage head-tail connector protein [Ornithinibacillus xuwenensis]|uniref:Phage head-tail connector protein n=1 Tax=Ornithinibacillus xuwenensis TaxID=3144668 RepID=A0ABU9XC37_9BACI
MTLIDEIAKMGEIDKTKYMDYLTIMIPILVEYAEHNCNNTFSQLDDNDQMNLPAGVKLFISESIKHKLSSKGLASRTMGEISYSYDTDLPDRVMNHLKPYKKVRFN